MEHRKQHLPLIALAAGMLALASGCTSTGTKADVKSEAKKPDVTQLGVLPPPQETTRPVSAATPGGAVVPVSAVSVAPGGTPQAAPGAGSPLAKLTGRTERKVVATEMAVGWQPRIASLPDPVRSGRMSPGIVGQMFLFGGTKLEFAQADGTLTVDLIDETPRSAGQPAAKPERWQFSKEILRNLQTRDETFGKSYVLFLPWPTYTPDITRVRISARYDPDTGHTLFAAPNSITLDASAPHGTPVWTEKANGSVPIVPAGNRQLTGSVSGLGGTPVGGQPIGTPISGATGAPIPIGGPAQPSGPAMVPIQPSGTSPMMPIPSGGAMMPVQPAGSAPMIPVQPIGAMMPIPPGTVPAGGAAPSAPPGTAPMNPAPLPEGLSPLTITLPTRQ